MFSFQRLIIAPLLALGLLAVSTRSVDAGAVSVSAEIDYPMPSMTDPGEQAAGLFVVVSVAQGWYFDGLSFTGLANEKQQSLSWNIIGRSELWRDLEELRYNPSGGGALGYLCEIIIYADTPPGVYDRNPRNPNAPAMVTVSAYSEDGDYATDFALVSFTIPGPIVPEPASVLLLGIGLLVPAAAARSRRRRAG